MAEPRTARDMAFLDDLGLSDDQVSLSSGDLDEHSHDFGTERIAGRHPPDAVVWPTTTEEVAAVLAACNARGVPVVPYAAATSLEGHVVPVHGGVSLDMTRMDRVLEVRPTQFQVDVEPGVFGDAVDEAVGRDGLFFPPLPSSGRISTIGGMIANDASGMRTVKYGEVRDWVLALEAVLADGTVLRAGSRARKTSAGYNLKDLIVGSEGTLAVVTQATLRLAGRPEHVVGGRAVFADLDAASDAVAETILSGVDVATIELVDALSARMANKFLGLDLPDAPMVFLEVHGNSRRGVDDEVARAGAIFDRHGVERWEMGKSREAMEQLWQARREMAFAILAFDPALRPLHAGDVTVPIDRLTDIIRFAKDLGDEHDLLVPCFGHAGDGNVHYSVMVRDGDADHEEVGEKVHDAVVRKAIEMGGTSTGEHGIGIGKRQYLAMELGEGAVRAMRAIKAAWDPNGILNPGKIFAD